MDMNTARYLVVFVVIIISVVVDVLAVVVVVALRWIETTINNDTITPLPQTTKTIAKNTALGSDGGRLNDNADDDDDNDDDNDD